MKINIFAKIKKELPSVERKVLLKEYTTFKIGGPAKYFFIAKDKEDLIKAIEVSKKYKLPIFILGGGSNILVSDKGFNGLVIKLQILDLEIKGNQVYAGSSVMLNKLASTISKNNFTGFEWAAGIPGTVGGAVYGNAQAFGTKISDAIDNVEVLDIKTLKFHPHTKRGQSFLSDGNTNARYGVGVKNFSKSQCKFTLKNSIFKKNKNLIVTSVVFKLEKGKEKEIKEKIDRFLKHRKTNHPISFPSAGSVFVNPEIKIKNKKLLVKYPELNELNKLVAIPSGYFIEKCGLKGKQIGGAKISEKHANFIVNAGGAKAKDVLVLMNLAQKKVKQIFNVNLETEIQRIGF